MNNDEIRVCLALAVAEVGLGTFAIRHGINRGNLYQVLNGIRGPQPEHLSILGLRRVVDIVQVMAPA